MCSLPQRFHKILKIFPGASFEYYLLNFTLLPVSTLKRICCHRRRLQATNQRVLQLSRESLLSLSSKMVLHEATLLRERSGAGSKTVVRLDAQTTAVCTNQTTLGGRAGEFPNLEVTPFHLEMGMSSAKQACPVVSMR